MLRTNTTFTEEYSNKRGVVHFRPVSNRKHQRVIVVWWRVTELQITVNRNSGVVKSESKKGQLEVQVFVHLKTILCYLVKIPSTLIIT